MRSLAVAAALGLLALPAVAQTPDSVAWRRYFPLAVGNAWEYLYEFDQPANPYGPAYRDLTIQRHRIVARHVRSTDTLYAMAAHVRDSLGVRPERRDTLWVRYDEAMAGVVDESTGRPAPLHLACGLDVPLGGRLHRQNGCGMFLGRPDSPSPFPARFSAKSVDNYVWGGRWVADVGMLYASGGCEPCSVFDGYQTWRLVRATVGGTTYEVGQTTVAAERPHASEAMTLHPSVTRTAATLRLAAPSTVEAFDMTGRRVYRADASAGEHRVNVSAWAPGLYLVRAGSETRRLVVR